MSQSQALWLMVSAQSALYGVLWWLAARSDAAHRRALRWIGAFNLVMAPALLLVALRGRLPAVLAHGLGDALVLYGFTAMGTGACLLLEQALPHRGFGRVPLLATPVLLAMALWPALIGRESGLMLCLLAWLIGAGCWACVRGLSRHGETRLAWVLGVVAVPCVLVVAARGMDGLVFGLPIAAERDASGATGFAIFGFFGMSAANGVLAYATVRAMVGTLEQQSRHDELTGLFNRRGLMEALQRRWGRWIEHGQDVGVLLLDLDHFKAINDRHGHAGGDAVLVGVGAQLAASLGPDDLAGRLGGEEFLVVLAPGLDSGQMRQRAEHLRMAVAATRALPDDARVTTSIGIALATVEVQSLDVLLARADAALYRAKALGRDRICLDGEQADAGGTPAGQGAPVPAGT